MVLAEKQKQQITEHQCILASIRRSAASEQQSHKSKMPWGLPASAITEQQRKHGWTIIDEVLWNHVRSYKMLGRQKVR